MRIIIKKLIFEFIGGMAVSLLACPLFAAIFSLSGTSGLGISLGGDKAGVFFGIFLGLPLGSLFGILMIDKIFYEFQGYNISGMFTGFILSFVLGGIGGVMLLDKIGGTAIILVPLIIVILSLLGYNIPLIIK